MDPKQKQIDELKQKIAAAERNLISAKNALLELTNDDTTSENLDTFSKPSSDKIVEGIFNGENMVGPENKIYPVPANYASKSKLVEGDRLKLTINPDGSFLFKQIGPVNRKKLIGELKFENNAYHVEAEGQNYSVLYASVTYHKAKPGDKVVIVVPAVGEPHWSVLESIIHDITPEDKAAAEKIIEERVAEEMKAPTPEPILNTEAPAVAQPTDTIEPFTTTSAPLASEAIIEPMPGDFLDINNLEIKGPNNAPLPEEVASTDANASVAPVATVQVTDDIKATPISEMEI